jgi:hypothetical protein
VCVCVCVSVSERMYYMCVPFTQVSQRDQRQPPRAAADSLEPYCAGVPVSAVAFVPDAWVQAEFPVPRRSP